MTEKLDWTKAAGGFGQIVNEHDLYGYEAKHNPDPQVTETYYWTFFNTEANLHGYVYFMMRPNIGAGTYGVFAHFGSKRDYLAAEFFDFRTYMLDDFADASGNISTPLGLTIEFVEPMKTMHICCVNEERGFELDMIQEAVQPPIVRSNSKHFEQTMRVTGSVVIGGVRYPLDHYAVRDRSWGEPRPETGVIGPPYTWMTGVHSKDLAFTIGAFDDPRRDPDWKDLYMVDERDLVRDAWLYDRGEQLRFTSVSKVTKHGSDGLTPARNIIDCVASNGREYHFEGEVTANLPWKTWQNAMCHVGLTRWVSPQLEGEFWGITAEVQWNHYISKLCAPLVL